MLELIRSMTTDPPFNPRSPYTAPRPYFNRRRFTPNLPLQTLSIILETIDETEARDGFDTR